ncbi:Ig-like domain-containing protein [Methanobrevibacter sp. UBA188]|uniref:Ig-like domain-containing protein n=1 Tax=Methanobrevibacter sp. UBA188 TaxID=1915473 RepID=UPI0025DF661C|nr:Ig-like domain-containing protein [Methanobrevibacter sp. UBA188]
MRYKKMMLLTIFFVSLFAVSAVNAADNATDDVVSIEDAIDDTVSVNNFDGIVNDDELDEMFCSTEDNSVLSLNQEEDILTSSPPYNKYSVSVNDVTMNYGSSANVVVKINMPASGYSYKYDFHLKIYDSKNIEVVSKNYYSSSSSSSITHSLSANSLSPGTYTIKILNFADNKVMDTATLTVKDSLPYNKYSVDISDISYSYGYSSSIKMSITPASGYFYKYNYFLKVYNSNNVEVISKQYSSTSSSYSQIYSLSATALQSGEYTVKIINTYDNYVMDTAMLTVKATLPYSSYSVSVNDVTYNSGSTSSIKMSITPSKYSCKYDYYLKVYDANNVEKISKQYSSTSSAYSQTYSLSSTSLAPGIYTVKIINSYDDHVMDTAKITVKSVPYSAYSVSIDDVSVNYGSNALIQMTISPSSGYNYKYDYYLKIYDKNNVEKVSKRYYSTSSSYSQTYSLESTSLNPGSYTVKIINSHDSHVMDSAKLTIKSVPYSAYSVSVEDVSLNNGYEGSIKMFITPASEYYYKYDYYLKVYDSKNNEKISKRYFSTSSHTSKTYSLAANSLSPGVYTIKIINNYDNNVMTTAKLTIHQLAIQFQGVNGSCADNVKYTVRVSDNGNYGPGLAVTFTCSGKQYTVYTDNQGYATLNIHLKAGKYDITAKCIGDSYKNTITVYQLYVENDYKNMYVESLTGYYNSKNNIKYGWDGYFKGYFKIYKGNSVVYEIKVDTTGVVSDYKSYDDYDYTYQGSAINNAGTYKAVITDVNGKILSQATIKINKAQTHVKSKYFVSKIGARKTINAYVYDKSNSKKGIGGTAKFKINGKTYTVKVKDGVATLKKIIFPLKSKTYKCKITFSGDKNHKRSSVNFKFKLAKSNVVILKKNRSIKVGKYIIKLSPAQYKSLVKAFKKGNYKLVKMNTKYKHNVKKSYQKPVKKYKTTKAIKTLRYGSYLPMIREMRSNGWSKVSEYTYTKANPYNKYGIGLSAYTYAVCKWVKISYKTAYKTKAYPIKAKIRTQGSYSLPVVEIYSHGSTLQTKYVAIA